MIEAGRIKFSGSEMTMKKAHYLVEGDGEPVILLHGLAASLLDWQPYLPVLAQDGYRGYALDMLGHGDSCKPDHPYSCNVHSVYNHFREWMENVEVDQPIHLVGHSFGGYLGLVYTLQNPDRVKSLTLVSPFFQSTQLALFLRMFHRQGRMGEVALRMAPARLMTLLLGFSPTRSRGIPLSKRKQIAQDLKRASPMIMYIPGSMKDLTRNLPTISQPVLVLWGQKDRTLSPSSFPWLVEQIPNATGYALKNSGHQPHISAPKTVQRLLLQFLNSIPSLQ